MLTWGARQTDLVRCRGGGPAAGSLSHLACAAATENGDSAGGDAACLPCSLPAPCAGHG